MSAVLVLGFLGTTSSQLMELATVRQVSDPGGEASFSKLLSLQINEWHICSSEGRPAGISMGGHQMQWWAGRQNT